LGVALLGGRLFLFFLPRGERQNRLWCGWGCGSVLVWRLFLLCGWWIVGGFGGRFYVGVWRVGFCGGGVFWWGLCGGLFLVFCVLVGLCCSVLECFRSVFFECVFWWGWLCFAVVW